jgi:cytochrome P450
MAEPASASARPFDAMPRAPMSRILGRILRGGLAGYDLRRMQEAQFHRYGPSVRQGRGRFTSVNLFGADANRFVLLDRDQLFSARQPWTAIMGTIFPNGLLLRDGEEHKQHRKVMHQAFTRPVLREYVERMNPAIDRGVAGWPTGVAGFRAYDAFKALTLDMAASIFVGVDLGPSAVQMYRAFEAMVAASMPGLRFPGFGRHHRGVEGRRFMLRFLGDVLPKMRADTNGSLFARLSRARDEDGRAFSDADVLDHMSFLMMAAHDTTTSTLTSLTYELARNPDWQDRIREECVAFGQEAPGFDQLDSLPSLTWAMRETLRRYPPLPVIPRTSTRVFEWDGYRIPAGVMVVVSPIHTHHMEAWWPDADRWDPERFSPARAEHERHSHCWIPFGGGPHMCIGRRFGEAQVRLVMHHIVRRYRWRVPDGYRMPVQQAPISKPTDGLPLELESLH